VSNEAATVALHGQALFDERRTFYQAIDELFAGGNLGGARISGRRPGAHELLLRKGRQSSFAAPAKPSVQVVEGSGGTMEHAAGAAADSAPAKQRGPETTAARLLTPQESQQPAFPATKTGHDSLQYHFFFPGFFLATRVFSTASLQHHSAWLCTTADNVVTELHSTNSDEQQLRPSGAAALELSGDEMHVSDNAAGASLTFSPRDPKAASLLQRMGAPLGSSGRPELEVKFDAAGAYGWLPAGQETEGNIVLHRPDLSCSVQWDGAELRGVGYSKRYYGPYPPYWGYRFIHGVGASSGVGDTQMLALSPHDARAPGHQGPQPAGR
jgi:hypothetical protein